MADASASNDPRMKYNFLIVLAGLGIVAAVFIISVFTFKTAADITAVVGSITGVIGTLVGTYFGVHVGAIGKDKADAQRQEAQDKALAFAAALMPDNAQQILKNFHATES